MERLDHARVGIPRWAREPTVEHVGGHAGQTGQQRTLTLQIAPRARPAPVLATAQSRAHAADPPGTSTLEAKGRKRRWLPFIVALAVGVPLMLFVRQNVAVFGMAQGDSMSPAVPDDSFLVVDKLTDQVSELERGDVVALLQPSEVDFDAPPLMEGPYLVKRVIALPGEVVEIRDSTVYVDGVALVEPYLAEGLEYPDEPPVAVPDRAVYVLGDNRPDSTDSRAFGPVAEVNLVGRIALNVAPPD